MDSFELNKIAAAIILALLVGMVANLVSRAVVHPVMLTKNVFEVEVPEGAAGDTVADAKQEAEPIEALLASADIARGEQIAKKCVQCHTFDEGGAARMGPNLWNIVGAKIASKEGYAYSGGLKEMSGEWNYDYLNKFLFKPRDFIPGTKMSFAGLSKTQDRADLIAYLRTLSAAPKPLP